MFCTLFGLITCLPLLAPYIFSEIQKRKYGIFYIPYLVYSAILVHGYLVVLIFIKNGNIQYLVRTEEKK